MGDKHEDLAGMSPNEAAAFAVNSDVTELFAEPGVVQPEAGAVQTQPGVVQAEPGVVPAEAGVVPAEAEVVPESRPATTATALRIDLGIQAELETAAAARGVGSSTLMRQIIEDWVAANRDMPAPDHLAELVRHLDAARQAATSLSRPAA
jgi:hypothetical protein